MSIQKISKEPSVLEARRTVVVTQDMSLIGTLPFQVNLQYNQVDFVPTRMVIRQISYVNQLTGPSPTSLTTEQGIYTLYCSLPLLAITTLATRSPRHQVTSKSFYL